MANVYYCYVEYFSIHILGIPKEKFKNFLTYSGMRILEDKIDDNLNPHYVIVSNFDKSPYEVLTKKLNDSKDELKEKVKEYLEDYNIKDLDYPEIYRAGYYCYVNAMGKDFIKAILKDKLVDPTYSSPSNVLDVFNYYGIESSRLFYIKEYLSSEDVQKMNPVNIELLVDFQTATGVLLSVTSTDISKHGRSALAAASFEQPLEAFRKAGTIGTNDKINNIASCLMTGKRCKNGTGIVEIVFDEEYLNNPTSKFEEDVSTDLNRQEVTPKEILGSCFAQGKFIHGSAESDEEKTGEEVEEEAPIIKAEKAYSSSKRRIKSKASVLLKEEVPEIEISISEDEAPEDDIYEI